MAKEGSNSGKLAPIEEGEEGERVEKTSGPISRSSVKLVFYVIEKFDKQKRDIVISIGWGGILSLPPLNKINLKFAVWLLSKVDEGKRAIIVSEEKVYKFDGTDVGKCFGVPSSGRDVRDKTLNRNEVVFRSIRSRLGISSKDVRSCRTAQAILERDYGGSMSPSEMDDFKTAFVVFMMTHLFAPTTKHDYFSTDYWPALLDPSEIHNFNGGEYVFDELCDAAAKLRSDIRKKNSIYSVSGNLLWLEVFYLDNIVTSVVKMDYDILPRIRAYTQENIKSMIKADKVHSPCGTKSKSTYGASSPKTSKDSAYSKYQATLMQARSVGTRSNTYEICEMEVLHPKIRDIIYLEMKAHEDTVAQHVQELNRKFKNRMEVVMAHYAASKDTENLNGGTEGGAAFNKCPSSAGDSSSRASCGRTNNSTVVSTTCDDITLADVSSPVKRARSDKAPMAPMKKSRARSIATDWAASGIKCTVQNVVCGSFHDLNAGVNHALNLHKDAQQNVVVWDDVPSFDLGIDGTPPQKLPRNLFGCSSSTEQNLETEQQDNMGRPDIMIQELITPRTAKSVTNGTHDRVIRGVNQDDGRSLSLHLPGEEVTNIGTSVQAMASKEAITPRSDVADSIPPNWYIGEQTRKCSPSTVNKIIQDLLLFEKDTRFTDKINLNAKTLDFDISCSPFMKRKVALISTPMTNCVPPKPTTYDEAICRDFYEFVASMEPTSAQLSVWVMHSVPSYIELSAEHIKKHMCGKVDMDHDIISVFMRRLKQTDDGQVGLASSTRFKHYMEADVMTRILAGDNPSEYKTIRQQFIGDHISYELPYCTLILFPAYINFAWCCYAIHTIKKKLIIFDPTFDTDTSNYLREMHLKISDQLKLAMSQFAKEFFDSWQYNFDDLVPEFFLPVSKLTERHLSGFHTVNFCKYYNGLDMKVCYREDKEMVLPSFYLYDLMHLKGNTARRPPQFIQSVEE